MNLQSYIPEFPFLPAIFTPRYTHRLYKNYEYTDQVRQNMLEKSSSWVVDRIFALQLDEKGRFNGGIQHWSLKKSPDGTVLLMCADEQGQILYFEQGFSFDFPSGDLSFVLKDRVLNVKN